MERRDFIRKSGRLFFLGGMAFGVGYLIANGKIEKYSECKLASTCNGCGKIAHCNEDQANEYRQNQLFAK